MSVSFQGRPVWPASSLLIRIMAGLLASLALVFTVQWLAAKLTVGGLMMDFVGHELLDDAEELRDYLVLDPALSAAGASIRHADPAYAKTGSGRYYQILVDGQPALRSPTLGQTDLHPPRLEVGQTLTGRTVGPDGLPVLFGARSFAHDGHNVLIETGVSISPVDERIDRLLVRLGFISATMFVALLAIQYAIVYAQLRVLARIRSQVEAVVQGERQRLDEEVPREVLPLVREINRMSETMKARLTRSRQALGNLAHALKTPLSRLTQSAHEQTRANTGHESMQTQLDALRRRIDLELKRARLAGPSSINITFNLSRDIAELGEALRKLHADKALRIKTDMVPMIMLHADREDMLELVGNLLDNACKFAAQTLYVRVRTKGGLLITVEDDGPGCDDAHLAKLTGRGWRGDEKVEGSGLGLAIVADIASSYGATLSFRRSESLGGLKVEVLMPEALLVDAARTVRLA